MPNPWPHPSDDSYRWWHGPLLLLAIILVIGAGGPVIAAALRWLTR